MRHVYLHVPFCARRCSYCDFAIAVRKQVPADRYLAAIGRELELRRAQGEWDDEPGETVYFGGGTPSLLPPDQLTELVELFRIGPSVRRSGGPPVEITLEANPEDVSRAAAATWGVAGVNRVSLGAQSFDAAVLRWMHRIHGSDAVPRAVEAVRQAGIRSISLDLIFGLPEDLDPSFERSLERALELSPDHLSVYGLSVEPRTPLARWISRGATTAPSDQRYAAEFLHAHDRLTAAGYEHYEVSNYARPGFGSRHNSAYWSDRDYAGLGPAAHSFRSGERRWNLSHWAAYERRVLAGADPTEQREHLTPGQRNMERLYLGLRTSRGIERAAWWHIDPEQEGRWVSQGWLVREDDRYSLTPQGWLRLDALVPFLTTLPDSG